MKISVEALVKSDINTVWRSWTTPEDINQWNAASDDWHNPRSENDLKVGGRFSYRMEARDGSRGFDFEGTYTKIDDKSLIEFKMDDGRLVSIDFRPENDGVRVIETFDAEGEHSAEQQRQGWQSIIDNFARHVEAKARRQ